MLDGRNSSNHFPQLEELTGHRVLRRILIPNHRSLRTVARRGSRKRPGRQWPRAKRPLQRLHGTGQSGAGRIWGRGDHRCAGLQTREKSANPDQDQELNHQEQNQDRIARRIGHKNQILAILRLANPPRLRDRRIRCNVSPTPSVRSMAGGLRETLAQVPGFSSRTIGAGFGMVLRPSNGGSRPDLGFPPQTKRS